MITFRDAQVNVPTEALNKHSQHKRSSLLINEHMFLRCYKVVKPCRSRADKERGRVQCVWRKRRTDVVEILACFQRPLRCDAPEESKEMLFISSCNVWYFLWGRGRKKALFSLADFDCFADSFCWNVKVLLFRLCISICVELRRPITLVTPLRKPCNLSFACKRLWRDLSGYGSAILGSARSTHRRAHI